MLKKSYNLLPLVVLVVGYLLMVGLHANTPWLILLALVYIGTDLLNAKFQKSLTWAVALKNSLYLVASSGLILVPLLRPTSLLWLMAILVMIIFLSIGLFYAWQPTKRANPDDVVIERSILTVGLGVYLFMLLMPFIN